MGITQSTAGPSSYKSFKRMTQQVIQSNLPPVEQLKQDIKEYFDDEKLLEYAIAEFEKYKDMAFFGNKAINDFEVLMQQHVESYLTNKTLSLWPLAYGRDSVNATDGNYIDPVATVSRDNWNNSPILTIVNAFCENFEKLQNYHKPLQDMKRGIYSEWLTPFEAIKMTEYMLWYSFIHGNNHIYIDLLYMIKNWVTHMLKCMKGEAASLDIIMRAKKCIEMDIPSVTFKPLNELMIEKVYSLPEYKQIYGNALLYFYVDGNKIIVDVSHELYDTDQSIMNNRLSNLLPYDIAVYDPLRMNYPSVSNKKFKGSISGVGVGKMDLSF